MHKKTCAASQLNSPPTNNSIAMVSSALPAATEAAVQDAAVQYNTNLRAPVATSTHQTPQAPVHALEWQRLMEGYPVQINPSIGSGYKVMSVREWAARFAHNDDFPECSACGSTDTKEHHFVQTWCRGKKKWTSEVVCLDCHAFTLRDYVDPDFLTPEEHMKQLWRDIVKENQQ